MLYVAAMLMLITGLAHSYLGERFVLMRLQRDSLPKLFGSTEFTAGTLRFVWHLLTVAWWGLAWLVLISAGGSYSSSQALQVVAAVAFVSAVLPLYFTRGKHLSWVVFLLVGALLLLVPGPGR
jgi:hypothetical protein